MAFDNDTRNKLANLVGKCRALLTDEFLRQCQSTFGIQPDGLMISLEDLGRLSDDQLDVAHQLRGRIDYLAHNEEADNSIPNSIDKMLREQAFTVLNRLAAMKMAEARGLIVESVSKGQESEGFQMYDMIGGSAMGDKFARYVCYLRSMFDEIAVDLGSLFDRFSPFGLLFPNEDAFGGLLELLNQKELEHLWAEDETIGWIYQYWNSKEERKAMRDASDAPRNSRELAVRNQFFTPRYVVEFLTDNTLGRTWYEMTKGETRLADQCRYLVRRPTEIFLNDGEDATEQPEQEGLSQEELLKQPVYIQHRPFKDPREIRLLDPACGSMHFGLYAFDLFEAIYEEGWEKSIGTLKQDFPDKAEFLVQVPRLIIENNIHGVDIDPRAVQIAGLSLWLRAQRSWKNQSVQPGNRPQIRKSNIVCAEPMPGDESMLEEFLETLDPPLLRDLVRTVFEKMKLAGEAGTLLKIEEEIRSSVQDARNAAHEMRGDLFTQGEAESDDFFNSAEERIYEALQNYAESAESGNYQRRLFAEDAAHGFAFIELCRKRYDSVVMNPPFGQPSSASSTYLGSQYPDWNKNILCGFVKRTFELLNSEGKTGAIFDRTILVKKTYTNFRLSTLVVDDRISALCDLGWEVLDANVEVSSFVLTKGHNTEGSFYDVRNVDLDQKADQLQINIPSPCSRVGSAVFARLPNAIIGYDFPQFLLNAFGRSEGLSDSKCQAYTGHQLPKERHFRLWWENRSPYPKVSKHTFKGGSFFLYVASMREWLSAESDLDDLTSDAGINLRNKSKHFIPGVCYGERGDFLNVYTLPREMYFTLEGPAIPCQDAQKAYSLLAFLNSPAVLFLTNKLCGQHKTSGYVNLIPFGDFSLPEAYTSEIKEAVLGLIMCRESDETQLQFSPFDCRSDLSGLIASASAKIEDSMQNARKVYDSVDNLVREFFELSDSELQILDSAAKEIPEFEYPVEDFDRRDGGRLFFTTGVLSMALGTALGRWDIRYATGEHQPPELPDPFAPLPVRPPGMLQNADGLPASEYEVPEDYPIRISWPGILVDDEGHPEDIITRVREALSVIWKDNSSSIEQEACEILKVKSLRDYFAEKKSGGKFFKDHLKRYSKSRRKAPIYWPLSTESGSYTLWIYYHRLTDQTLYQCVSDFIEPKIEQCEKDLQMLNQQFELGQADGKTNDQISELKTLINELKNFRDELLNVAKLPYKPNLNDGVQITAAPLWKCFRLGPWQKTLKDTWKKLEKGDYDWAHLSYSIWPERVKDKCIKDKSLAIAHGLEDVYIEPPAKAKKAKKASTEALDLE